MRFFLSGSLVYADIFRKLMSENLSGGYFSRKLHAGSLNACLSIHRVLIENRGSAVVQTLCSFWLHHSMYDLGLVLTLSKPQGPHITVALSTWVHSEN